MNFKCPWDATVTSTTVTDTIIPLILAVIFYALTRYYIKNEEILHAWVCRLAVVLCIIVPFPPALFCPLSVSLKDEAIQVHRITGNIVIPYNEITEIRRFANSDISDGRREFGSGGSFGYLGKFSSQKLGNYQMYVTDAENRILVKNKKEEYLIFSCDKPDELIKIVNQCITN